MKNTKRFLSIILAFAMLLSTVSGLGITAFAIVKKDTYFVFLGDYPNRADIGQTVKYKGTLYDTDNNPVIGAGVTAVCDNITASATTDNTGYFELSFTPNSVGTFPIVISYAGNSTYNGNTVENLFSLKVVSRVNYNVSYEVPAAVKSGDDLTVSINVKDKDGVPVQSKTVSIGFEIGPGIYKSKYASTDENGNASPIVTTEGDNGKKRVFVNVFGTDDYYDFREYFDIYVTESTAYRITAKSEGSGGSVSKSTVYLENETATVTASEDTLGIFRGWYENGVKVSDNKVYTFTATANRVLAAHFITAECIHEKNTSYLTRTEQQNATCTAAGYEAYYTCSECNKLFSDSNGKNEIPEPVVINALNHSWGTANYSWENDNSTVTATRVCTRDSGHIETETANVSSYQSKAPACTEKGETTYTASFTNTAFETQSKTLENINALGHIYGSQGNARFTCTRCHTVDNVLKTAAEAADKEAADEAAATAVENEIAALPDADKITTADKKAIEEAKTAYDALTNDQKAKVNPTAVTRLENAIAALEAAERSARAWDEWEAKRLAEEKAAKEKAEEEARKEAEKRAAEERAAKERAAKEKAENEKTFAGFVSGFKGTSKPDKISVKWGKVNGAKRYVIYAAYCPSNKLKKIKTVKGDVTSYEITKLGGKKLNPNKNATVYIVAQKKVGKKYVDIFKTPSFHIAGAKTKLTNAKKINVKKDKFTLTVKKNAKIKPSLVRANKNKKMISHAAKFRFKSTNTAVAKVDKNGKITAVGKGKCKVYVYANNGCAKAVKITVK